MKRGLLLLCAAVMVAQISAQTVVSARAGLITYLQGPAFVDGKRVVLKTARFQQMKDGETLSTGRGRVEMLLGPSVPIRLSEDSQVRLDDAQLSDTHVTLLRGEALIEIVNLPDGNRIRVEAAQTTTELSRPGLYRFGISQNATAPSTLRVYGGEALVRAGSGMVTLKRGMKVDLDADLTVGKFDRKQKDLLHSWAARRSFDLFMSDPDARLKQSHWEATSQGSVWNKNFDVEFRAFLRRPMPPPVSRTVPRAESQ